MCPLRTLFRDSEDYEVDEETAREDIQEFLDTLIRGGILDDSGEEDHPGLEN